MTEQLSLPFGHETSRAAIKEFTASGEKKDHQDKIIAFMERWPYQTMTAREIGLATGVSAHKRLPELAAMGKVERVQTAPGEAYKRICAVTGRPAMTWRLTNGPSISTFQASDDLPGSY